MYSIHLPIQMAKQSPTYQLHAVQKGHQATIHTRDPVACRYLASKYLPTHAPPFSANLPAVAPAERAAFQAEIGAVRLGLGRLEFYP